MSTTSAPTTTPTDPTDTDPTLSQTSTTTTTTETTTATEDPPTTTPTDSGTTTTTDPPGTTPTSDPPTTPPPTTTRPPTTPGPPPTTPRPGTSTSISYGSQTISLPGGGVTTIITSVIVVDGKTVTTVVPGPSQTSTDSGGGNNNIGTIVGASVGGAIAVALIGLLWFILARKARERRHKAFENDIFNPDHGTRGPNFDLGGGPDPETIPDPYQLEPQQMHQYPGYNGYPAPIATGGYAATGPAHPLSPHGSNPYYDAQSATSGGTAPGLAGVGVAGALGAGAYMHNRQSGTPTTGDGGSTGSADHASVQPLTGRQAKEREAFARSQRMSMPPGPAGPGSPVLAPGMLSPTHTGNASNAAYNYGMGPAPPTTSSVYSTDSAAPGSPIRSQHGHAQAFPGGFGVVNPDHVPRTSTPGGGVVVHQDAGRVPTHEEQDGHDEGEIPPTYDSIPVDDRPAAASAQPPRPISAASGGRPASTGEARPGSATSNRLETDQRPHAI